MNFFVNQELARRQSRQLLWLFLFSLIVIVLAINAVAYFIYRFFYQGLPLPLHFFLTNTIVVLGLILGGTLFEIWRLREGGDAIAKMVGGRRILPGSSHLLERRLLNVVEEMALASGISVPNIYILDREERMNAFAAGYSPNQAVIVVTQGVLKRFTRDELQGVIGHEFSHILHGDMRLNIQLIGIIYGLLLVALLGEKLLSSIRYSNSSKNEKGMSLLLLFAGLALWALGYIGVFFGRMIRASISRQREFLADASSIQYTRNPDGIGSALRKIGGWGRLYPNSQTVGSEIYHEHAETLAHLFFGAARSKFDHGLFATHPPLSERIARIYGRKKEMLEPTLQELPQQNMTLPDIEFEPVNFVAAREELQNNPIPGMAKAEPKPPHSIANSLTQTIGELYLLPAKPGSSNIIMPSAQVWSQLRAAAQQEKSAQGLVYAFFFAQGAELRDKQRKMVTHEFTEVLQHTTNLYPLLQQLPSNFRLSLFDLIIPTVRGLSQEQQTQLLKNIETLIMADGKINLEEFVLETILTQRLQPRARIPIAIKYQRLTGALPEMGMVLSLIAVVATNRVNMQEQIRKAIQILNIPAWAPLFQEPDLIQVKRALQKLNALQPLVKPILIKSFITCAEINGLINQRTIDLIHALCAAIDSPLPPQIYPKAI